MKKSIKKYLREGSIIITKYGYIYQVTELLKHKFKCKPLNSEFTDDYRQEFYYNIDMTIYEFIASNFDDRFLDDY